ncbi:hypothetical protein KR054_009144, partial [Drosophila jambulina]
ISVTWISHRKELELEVILLEFGLDRAGTVEEQRARLIAIARQPDLPDTIQDLLGELERRYGNAPSGDTKPLAPLRIETENTMDAPSTRHTLALPRSVSPSAVTREKSERASCTNTSQSDANTCSMLIDEMTKWGLSFGGTSDPLSFVHLEHLVERAETYRVDRKYLFHVIIVLLTGRTDFWFRTSGLQGRTRTEVRRGFPDFFLPPRYNR